MSYILHNGASKAVPKEGAGTSTRTFFLCTSLSLCIIPISLEEKDDGPRSDGNFHLHDNGGGIGEVGIGPERHYWTCSTCSRSAHLTAATAATAAVRRSRMHGPQLHRPPHPFFPFFCRTIGHISCTSSSRDSVHWQDELIPGAN